MATYYYSGNVVRPITIKKGVSVAARPRSKIEIFEESAEVKALIKRGLLRRTGNLKKKSRVVEVDNSIDIKDVLPKSDLARNIAEKGSTTSSALPPVRKDGKQEMTDGELQGVSPEASVFNEEDKDVDKVEVLSDEKAADSSKDEGKEQGQGRKKKYSRKKK